DELCQLRASGHRCILFGRPSGREACSFFDTDNAAGAAMAVNQLAGCGWSHIAYCDQHDQQWYHQDRRRGWRRALKERGLPHDDTLLINTAANFSEAHQAVLQHLSAHPEIDAILIQGGAHTAATLYALRDLGRKPGIDIGIIMYDDDPDMAAQQRPALSAIAQRFDETAAEAAAMLLDDLAADAPPIRERIVQPSLVIRGSCGG
ncbi:MAG: substrate-binding domain-containing protein, partial [Planctomycetota bacterium]|nr:substrate-binding domain-containing protein [Planctomycetota bacterium]